MSTRSYIAKKTNAGYVAIYCHFDGYPSHHMPILQGHYLDEAKVNELLDLGSLSVLAPEIGSEHNFDNHITTHPEWCLSYHRDRGEKFSLHQADSLQSLMKHADENWGEYLYVYENGYWMVHNMRILPDEVFLEQYSNEAKYKIAQSLLVAALGSEDFGK